ncbi:T9SS type A sorting domain-containing protein [Chryseobacterium oranimense]|uniref:T9SS type A sorting domain-containing protein n=1 Tax=Chryseobacterium oranimense TaxID=421058 RepID=UPI00223575B6|nr:T9SS type A sorting domain-containing protein [Chryseobacterium oranimense]
MKKLYSILLILIIAQMDAQPVVSAAHAVQPGSLTYYGVDFTQLSTLTPGPSGANVSWDFSPYTSANTNIQTRYDCPGGNTNCTDTNFSQANKIIASVAPGGSERYVYFKYANNELLTLGAKSIDSGVTTYTIYTDPSMELKFPVTYLQTFTDSWAGNSTPGSVAETGTQTITVDAYGTLKTALGTFPNTLRVKVEKNITSSTASVPTSNTTFVGYSWISSSYAGVLLTLGFSETSITGGPVIYSRYLSYGKNTLTLGTDDVTAGRKMDIYPNPSSDYVNIKNGEKIEKIEMNNAEGRKISEFKKADKIDISGFPSGIYFLTITFKDGKTDTKKIIRE